MRGRFPERGVDCDNRGRARGADDMDDRNGGVLGGRGGGDAPSPRPEGDAPAGEATVVEGVPRLLTHTPPPRRLHRAVARALALGCT